MIRWADPESGAAIPPDEFIPLAEETSLINQIGEWVLLQGCRYGKALRDKGLPLRLGINVSSCQFRSGRILKAIHLALKQFNLPPELIELEITEGTSTMERHAPILGALAREGVTLAVDDFGTGYSNLAVLQTIRPQRIKLDMSLVRGIGRGQEAEALLLAALSLSRAFGAKVLAEGVETPQQRDFLLDHGCDEMQGYLFSKPVTFENLLMSLENPNVIFRG